jgi:hypothetical protein
MTINLNSKKWQKNYNSMESKMAKRLIPGKTRKSKGKKVSHRPVRSEGAYFDENDHKWYKRVEE